MGAASRNVRSSVLPVRLVLELAIFGLAAAALYAAGHPALAWALGVVFVINCVLMYVWGH